MSNFQYLKPDWAEIYDSAAQAESLVYSDARACCFYVRRTLELAVEWLYANDQYLQRPYDDSLSALIHEPTFKDNLAPGILQKAKVIKDLGNLAVHSNRTISQNDALQATKELFHILFWLARN